MKTTQVCFWNKWMRNGRNPAKPPLRFTEVKKLELKDRVTVGAREHAELACNAQMLDFMECLKTNDFIQSKCDAQAKAFRDCYSAAVARMKSAKMVHNKDEYQPGQKSYTTKQLNSLLRANKQPR